MAIHLIIAITIKCTLYSGYMGLTGMESPFVLKFTVYQRNKDCISFEIIYTKPLETLPISIGSFIRLVGNKLAVFPVHILPEFRTQHGMAWHGIHNTLLWQCSTT